jgi:hypothetical protein
VAAAALYGAGDDRDNGKTGGGTSSASPRTNPPGSTGPSPAASTPSDGGASTRSRTGTCAPGLPAAECTLAQRLPPDFADVGSCVRDGKKDAGEVAIVRCATPASARVGANFGYEVWATQFTTRQAMIKTLDVTIAEHGLAKVTVGCEAGDSYGKGPWVLTADRTVTQGQLLCYPTEGYGKLLWTYDRDAILMVATARDDNIPALVGWWSSPGRSVELN